MSYRWVPLFGEFSIHDNTVDFKGAVLTGQDGGRRIAHGIAMADAVFGGGTISAHMTISGAPRPGNGCGVILHRDTRTGLFICAQLGGEYFASVWTIHNNQSVSHGSAGVGTPGAAPAPVWSAGRDTPIACARACICSPSELMAPIISALA